MGGYWMENTSSVYPLGVAGMYTLTPKQDQPPQVIGQIVPGRVVLGDIRRYPKREREGG